MGRNDGSDRRVSAPDVDDSRCPILHVDMDAFFAAVELLDHPELVGRPAIVGHPTPRSVVTSATYEARRFGVRSAMPMGQAMRLCPDAVILEPHHARYGEFSRRVMEVFERFTPLVEQLSIDEAFLDVAGARRLIGSPAEVGRRLRAAVHAETGLICSVGVASTKFIAKMASGRAKPDGLLVVPPEDVLDFLHPQSVGALWGVGASTQEALARRGLNTIGDLASTPLPALIRAVGEASGRKLHALANGQDARGVVTDSFEKSIGHEMTFEHDVTDPAELRRELLRLSGKAAVRLRQAGLAGRALSLKFRYTDFRTISRSRTLPEATNVGRRIYDEVAPLADALMVPGTRVRLIGVRVEQLEPADDAPIALWDPDEEWRTAEGVIDRLADRFGSDAVRPAALVGSERRRVGDTEWLRPTRGAPRGDGRDAD